MTSTDPTPGPDRAAAKRVLVTGSTGAIGRPTATALSERGHRVRGFDRRPSDHLDDAVVAELTDRAAVDHAMRDVDCVVHLAATPSEAPFAEALLEPNVLGLFHVMDAARAAGVRRVVLASSCQAVSGHDRHAGPLPADAAPRPNNLYGLTKAWAEQMGELYARRFGLSVLAVRIGWLPRTVTDPATVPADSALHDLYISPRDAARFFTCAVEAETSDFAVLYATGPGRPEGPMCDLDSARQLIGYEPRDRWPEQFNLLPSND